MNKVGLCAVLCCYGPKSSNVLVLSVVPSLMQDDDNRRSIQETSESGIIVLDFNEVEAHGILAKMAKEASKIERVT